MSFDGAMFMLVRLVCLCLLCVPIVPYLLGALMCSVLRVHWPFTDAHPAELKLPGVCPVPCALRAPCAQCCKYHGVLCRVIAPRGAHCAVRAVLWHVSSPGAVGHCVVL